VLDRVLLDAGKGSGTGRLEDGDGVASGQKGVFQQGVAGGQDEDVLQGALRL